MNKKFMEIFMEITWTFMLANRYDRITLKEVNGWVSN